MVMLIPTHLMVATRIMCERGMPTEHNSNRATILYREHIHLEHENRRRGLINHRPRLRNGLITVALDKRILAYKPSRARFRETSEQTILSQKRTVVVLSKNQPDQLETAHYQRGNARPLNSMPV